MPRRLAIAMRSCGHGTRLLRWLHRALDEKLIRREGRGRKNEPFRYRLPNADDAYWDRGELPPLRELMR